MDEKQVADLVTKARLGNEHAREQLIAAFKPFISKISAEQCGRYLDWSNDDELSIALLAFNQAIDNFAAEKGAGFTGYAALIIRHRLIDYFRQEKKHRHLLFSQLSETGQYLPGEKEEAEKNYLEATIQENRREELLTFARLLSQYGISLEDLSRSSPHHLDTKLNLAGIARLLVTNRELYGKLIGTKQLPIKELINLTGASRKVLETGRRYIIALVIIFANNLYHLQAFIHLPGREDTRPAGRGDEKWLG